MACGNLRVLSGNGAVDIGSGKIEADELVGIDPHAHGALRGEQLGATDTFDTAQFAKDISVEVIAQRHLIHRAIGGGERYEHQEA